MATLTPLELVCFGAPAARLVGRETPREMRWRKHVALLVYLALSPSRSRTRDHLVGVFWAEQPERNARKSLNEAVYLLRDKLGEERLRTNGDEIVLNGDGLEVDALRLVQQAQSAPDDALTLLRGDFLEGFHVKDAPEFEDWMTRERERYRALAATTLIAAGERRLNTGRLADAADAARRALAVAGRSESAVNLLMRANALAGDATAALSCYQEFAARLKHEIGEHPGKALQALAERIRTEDTRRRSGPAAATEPPLLGREQIHRTAFDAVAKGRTLVIAAPPGMGRSRLLAECARHAALSGALIVRARPVESDQDAPWSALSLLIRAGITDAPGLAAAASNSLAAVAELAPELADRFPRRAIRDVADMATALTDVLRAVSGEGPVFLGLDDAHWADGASIAALGATLASLKNAPVAAVVTVAEGVGDPPRELLRFQSDVGRDVAGAAVRLGMLDEHDLAELVAALAPWCRDADQRDRLTRRIAFETGGNPFFAVTLLRALENATTMQADFVTWPPPGATHEAPPPYSVPSLVRHAIAVRVGELKPDEQAVLCAASVCGQSLEPDLIATVAERPVAEVDRALLAFERRHLVHFDGKRYAFPAPLIADAVRTYCLTRGERRALERRAVGALATKTDLESRALCAELLAHASPDRGAFDLALGVAREAIAQGARRTAQRMLSAADRIAVEAKLERAPVEELRARL
jgi:DNA-binding SARP family transcriptional activator